VTDRDLRPLLVDVVFGRVGGSAERPGELRVRGDDVGRGPGDADDGLAEAARVMRERRLGALPVVNAAGCVVGMLTERDLLDALQAVLRQGVVRASPAPGEPGSTYDTGVEPPPDADPWWDSVALD
jgi:hypothetical protein